MTVHYLPGILVHILAAVYAFLVRLSYLNHAQSVPVASAFANGDDQRFEGVA